MVGLLYALNRFDPENGTAFKTYAYRRIHGEVIDALRRTGVLSRDQMQKLSKVNAAKDKLSMVYDREMGSMKTMLVSPIPRWFLLISKLLAGVFVSILQVYAFLIIASLWDIVPPISGYFTMLPALIVSGLMLGSLGMFLSSAIKQLENFAGVMNFVIFPMFFASSALYPLWKIEETSEWLYYVCFYNPFTYAVESIRFSMYSHFNLEYGLGITTFTILFLFLSILGYDPARGSLQKKGGK